MLVVMERDAQEAEIIAVVEKMLELGFSPSRTTGHHQTVVAGIGAGLEDLATLQAMPGVWDVYAVSTPYPLAQRHSKRDGTIVQIGEHAMGSDRFIAFVRPLSHGAIAPEAFCAALPADRLSAVIVPSADAQAAAWREATAARGFALVHQLPGPLCTSLDAFLVTGSMLSDKAALREVAATQKPVILARPVEATLDEFLTAAEEFLSHGSANVVLSEQGIRTSERRAPVGFDVLTIPVLRRLTHLPIVVDAGRILRHSERLAVARAAAAAGADGLILDVDSGAGGHAHPRAVSAVDLAAVLDQAHALAKIIRKKAQK